MPISTTRSPLLRRRTKIVATLGPASASPEMVEHLIDAGTDVFRLNMSHGEQAGHAEVYATVRAVAARLGKPVGILADLCGPKIRTGVFATGSVELTEGATVTVTTRSVTGTADLIPSQYEALASDVKPGSRILLDDGNLELRVVQVDGSEVACRVIVGGTLRDRKGMNLPDVAVSAPSLTSKDRDDARFALDLGVDFLALSFVRRREDVLQLRAIVERAGAGVAIVSKIEKPEALDAIESILEVSDAIMVARGDLGVELPPERVPVAQSQLVDLARAHGKPVIVATQMLESMIEHPRPTRAEVSDVATAVFGGADAVMLSAETASGRHPVAAVSMMDRVARDAEGYQWQRGAFGDARSTAGGVVMAVEDAVARATAGLSRDLMVRAIVVFSRTGHSASIASAWRPQAPIIAASANESTCRRLMLSWGTIPVHGSDVAATEFPAVARRLAREAGLAEHGDFVLLVSGFQPDAAASAPAVTVLQV
ncbi:MAG TPA: pyruvate kinase [Gemmatimonadales bacterium]